MDLRKLGAIWELMKRGAKHEGAHTRTRPACFLYANGNRTGCIANPVAGSPLMILTGGSVSKRSITPPRRRSPRRPRRRSTLRAEVRDHCARVNLLHIQL